MSVRRLEHIPGFHIDRVAAAAGDDPTCCAWRTSTPTSRRPKRQWRRPERRSARTRRTAGCRSPAATTSRRPWPPTSSVAEGRATTGAGRSITCGEGDAMLDALFCLTDPGTRSSSPTRPTRACSTGCGWSGRCPASRSRSAGVATRSGDAAGRGHGTHARGLPEQRVVSVRVGGDRGVGGGCLDLPRAGPVAAVLGRIRRRAV